MKRLLFLVAAPLLLAAGCSAHTTTGASPGSTTPAATATSPAGTSGAGGAPTSAPATASATRPASVSPTPSGTPRCHSADLSVKPGSGEGAAGSRFLALVFTNTSGHTCTLYGYPGVSWVAGDDGHQVNEPFQRQRAGQKKTITVQAGGVAHATLQTHDVGFFDAATCKPVPVRGLRIYPPDETRSIFVALPGKACSAKAVNEGIVSVISAGAKD